MRGRAAGLLVAAMCFVVGLLVLGAIDALERWTR